ncbi:MAG: YqgE/AlgH family protein [Gammaproteobacteria bacterium]
MLACTALTLWLTACATSATEDWVAHGQSVRSQQAEPPSPRAKPETGVFLIASRTLTDPHFRESVVLLIEHTPSGTAGLIINRTTQVPISLALPQIPELAKEKDTVHIGGPVAPDSITLLVKTRHRMSDAKLIVNDIYLTASESVLRKLVKFNSPHTALRYYAGHAGWGPGQLEFELRQGSWYLLHVDTDVIFERKAEEMWPELIRHAEGVWTCRCSLDLGISSASLFSAAELFP